MQKMSEEIALYCLKAESERYSEICEECAIYGKVGCDHCCEDAFEVAIQAIEKQSMVNEILHECTELKRELDAYKEQEKQGLLLRLPCKVGDKAYYLHRVYLTYAGMWRDQIDEVEVDSFILNINLFVNVSYYIGSERFGMTLTPYKTLFFTREEAEVALEKMKGEEHEIN